jgi:photosystem II stability/assembly factor-like uncharacterized protein
MRTLAIGTEKGAYLLRRQETWQVEGPLFSGWKVTAFGRAPDGTYLAALASNWFGASIHRSPDLVEWEQVASGPTHPEDSERKLRHIWVFSSHQGILYSGVDDAGLFRSEDNGLTWEPLPALNEHPSRKNWFPGAGGMCVHQILHDGDRMWVGISAVGVFRSDDGGESFERFDQGVTPTVTADEDQVEESGWCVHGLAADPDQPDHIWRQDHRGVYRTTDGGDLWERIEEGLPAGFGFAIGRDHGSGSLFVVPLESDENRLPVGGQLAAYRSRNRGDLWERAGEGWPAAPQFTGVLRKAMSLDQQGGVAFGTTGGRIYLSDDAGENWSVLAPSFPRVLAVAHL